MNDILFQAFLWTCAGAGVGLCLKFLADRLGKGV